MYDVLYMNHTHRERVIARGLAREDACSVALAESQKRRVGRMFLAGSELNPTGELVVIVDSKRRPA